MSYVSKRALMKAGLLGLALGTGLALAPHDTRAQEIPYIEKPQKTMRLAHGVAPGMPYDTGAHRFAELVEQYTRGAIRVKVFPSSQLGLEQNTAKDVQLGTLDLTLIAINNASMWYKPLDVMIMPFIFRDRHHANAVVNGAVGKELFENYRKASGVRIVSVFEWGDRSIINKVRPINKPEDLKGVKIRLPKNAVMLDTYSALGATPAAIDWGELYSALQQGVADGLEGPPQGMLDMKFTDFLKNYSYVNIFYGLAVVLINDKAFDAMPKEHQQAILQAGYEAGEYQRWISAVSHLDGLKRLQETGVKVNMVADRNAFVEAVKPVYEKYSKEIGEDWIKKVRDAK
ncbi:MAG: TRAP transporter substrate-binding protein [Hyphomicrobiaceae bacterium]|nr:TRAP transporter substrate-binding protein [Hyphomicrobiaceae bacterium]